MGAGKNPPGIVGRLARPGLLWRACPVDSRVLEDPHIKARQAFIEARSSDCRTDDVVGAMDSSVQTPASIRDDSPAIATTYARVLGGLLGLSKAELGDLRTQGD